MRNRLWLAVSLIMLAALAVEAQQRALTVCDYRPPESRVSTLDLQGSFSMYDGPYADDRGRSVSASLVADYGLLHTSEALAQQVDLLADIRGKTSGWTAELESAASLRMFWENDLFAVGAIGVDATNEVRVEADATAGIGTGRFRDVTPLAKAISIQDALLDLGELLAPLSNETLLDLAQILGEAGPTEDERIVRIADRLEATSLTRGEELDVRALLEIGAIIEEADTSRVCGSDVQARIGLTASVLPEPRISTTGILLARYALVPDPVSQIRASVEAKLRLADLDQMSVSGSTSYTRRLPDGWVARATYRVDLDRMWSDAEATTWAHAVSSSLTTQLFGAVGMSLVANAEYQTGDEEITYSIGLLLEASF